MTPAELLAIIRSATLLIETATRIYSESASGSGLPTPEEIAALRASRESAESAYERMLLGTSSGGE